VGGAKNTEVGSWAEGGQGVGLDLNGGGGMLKWKERKKENKGVGSFQNVGVKRKACNGGFPLNGKVVAWVKSRTGVWKDELKKIRKKH